MLRAGARCRSAAELIEAMFEKMLEAKTSLNRFLPSVPLRRLARCRLLGTVQASSPLSTS